MNLVDKLKVQLSNLSGALHTRRAKGWKSVSVAQYLELAKYGDKLTAEDGLRIVYGVDMNTMPVGDLHKYSLAFLKDEPEREKIKKVYKLNGRKYAADFDTTKLTTAQFVDFQNYTKADDFVGCLSVCMRPVGHEYNDGYDVELVKADISAMPITQALTIAFFFTNQSIVLLQAIQYCSAEELKAMPGMKELAAIIEAQGLLNSGYSH